jgi:membrane protease subunit HflK
MTIALPWRRRLTQTMSDKPKSPWGGGGGGDSDGGNGDGGNGSGGKDAGPRNPWAQPPGSNPRPSRAGSGLEDLLRRARGGGGGGGFGGFNLPGGGGNGRSIWGLGVGLLVLAWVALTSIHVIGPQEQGVVTFFGKYSGTLDTGWRLTLPAPMNSVDKINVTGIRSFAFPEGGGANLVLTRDGNLVDLSYTVQWNVSDPQKYKFELDKPDDAVKASAESAIRAAIANATLDDILGAGKIEIQTRVRESMQSVLDDYQSGIRIVSVALNNASAPQQVMDAFKDVTAAQNDRQSNITQARGYAIQIIANAQSQAASFNGVYAQYKLAPDVTRRRIYYETMEQILNRVDKTIVEPRNIAPLLPLAGGKVVPNAPASGGDR